MPDEIEAKSKLNNSLALEKIMTLTGRIRARLFQAEIKRREEFYARERSVEEISSWQLAQFNHLWADIQLHVPFYRKLVDRRQLPRVFASWEQFQQEMPILTKDVLRENIAKMRDESRKPDFYSITSGSSAKPLKLHHWKSEERHRRIDMWVGRAWHGITPADRCFFLWGDRHRRRKNSLISIARPRRRVKDQLLGYFHFSSNDISPAKMHETADLLIRHKSDYLVGYSTSLEVLAKENVERQSKFADLKLKGIIASGCSYRSEESPGIISQGFQAPTIMEYGSEENGVLAYTGKNGKFRVFWQNTMLEGLDTELPERKNLLITSLYPRYIPIIRYEQGDEMELCAGEGRSYSLTEFQHLHGRVSDYIELQDGSRVMPISFYVVVKQFRKIKTYQIVSIGFEIELHLVFWNEKLNESELDMIRAMLSKTHPGLEKVRIKVVDDIFHTPRGKTPTIVHLQQ